MYYSSGNYEAFARPRKPEGVDNKSRTSTSMRKTPFPAVHAMAGSTPM